MSIVKVRKAALFLREKWDLAIRRAHKYLTFLIKNGGTSILKIRRDVT